MDPARLYYKDFALIRFGYFVLSIRSIQYTTTYSLFNPSYLFQLCNLKILLILIISLSVLLIDFQVHAA